MKGSKGGNRDRIISWLFSERTRKKRNEELELEQAEENKIDEKRKERRKSKKNNDGVFEVKPVIETASENILAQDEISMVTPLSVSSKDNKPSHEDSERKDELVQDDDDLDLTLIDIFDTSRDKKKPDIKDKDKNKDGEIEELSLSEEEPLKDKQPPTLFIDEDIVEEIKEHNKTISKLEEDEVIETSQLFPEVEEVSLLEDEVIDLVEKPELLQISIIEEIDNLLRNDAYDLRDIKYRIEVLNAQEKDEVLLENIEKIQKELEDLIKRFNEIKKKYDYAYSNLNVKDIDLINDLNLGFSISDYIGNGKDGLDNSTTLDQIHEIEEFIEIINNIIEIEKQKDIVEDSIDGKLIDFSIRDEEFIKLQDEFANIEELNIMIDKYNSQMDGIIADLENKIANNTEITRRIETTFEIVPDINRMLQATIMLASMDMIPPTPMGNLFRATLFVNAARMMANAFTPREETREIVRTEVTDYSKDILNSKATIKDVLGEITDAFDNIKYMKDTFEKEFNQYKDQIPEYDTLIKNIFSMEKELERQQYIAYDYSAQMDQALAVNNQKVKRLENE